MARLGGFEFPEITLSEAIEVGRRISREFGGSISRSSLAEVLEMSERGGRFAAVVGGLRQWGLVQGRGTLRVTRDGMRAVSPVRPEEAAQVRRTLALGVVLFDEIAGRIGDGGVDSANLTLLLEEITGAERSEVESRRPALERALNDVLPYLRASTQRADAPVAAASMVEDSEPPGIYRTAGNGRIRLTYSGGSVELEESLVSVEAVISLLEARRRELQG